MTEFETRLLAVLESLNNKVGGAVFNGIGLTSVQGIVACKYTFFDWLNEWFATYKVPNLKDGGYDMGNTIKKHVKPNMVDKALTLVDSLDITKCINCVTSERMRQFVYSIFNQSFCKACDLHLIDINPMDGVDTIDHEYENGRTLELQEQREFLCQCKKDKTFSALFQFYLLTGARPSEPLTIKWSYVKDNSIRIDGAKTKLSDRELPLFPALKKLLDGIPKKGDLIFPFTYSRVRKHFEKIRNTLSFAKLQIDNAEHLFTLKDLRHTFGTRCIESGVNMKTLQKWLGHSNYKTTESIYTHITSEFEQKEIQKFSDFSLKR